MFTKRKSFPSYRRYDKEFLKAFVADLNLAGFKSIYFVLPHNLLNDQASDVVTYEDFLARDRNYPSIILVAKNESLKETIKVLFVNISTKAFFKDDTFPSGHSEPSELFVQSSDPARAEGLFCFFFDYLKSRSPAKAFFLWFFSVLALFFILFEYFFFLGKKKGIFSDAVGGKIWLDLILFGFSIFIMFRFYSTEKGLYIKEKDNKLRNWTMRMLKGDLRDNPIVNLGITIVGGIVVAFILRLIGF